MQEAKKSGAIAPRFSFHNAHQVTASALPPAPSRRDGVPSDEQPTPRADEAADPSGREPIRTARHPSDDTRQSTQIPDAEAARSAQRSEPEAPREPQPLPAQPMLQARESKQAKLRVQSFSRSILLKLDGVPGSCKHSGRMILSTSN